MARGDPIEQAILRFLAEYVAEYGWAPSLTEIGEAVGLRSKASVHYRLRALERAGKIRLGSGPRMVALR